jgi:nucleotide-binding universal stress UspA family protein
MYQHILLPTDGSELSQQAVRSGVRLAASLGAKVTGLYVIVESLVAEGLDKTMLDVDTLSVRAAEQHLHAIAEEARHSGVPHECFHVADSSPSDGIIKVAAAKGCDLIFMASNGRRGLAGLLLGSETMHVLTHAKVPVLVYRS